MEFPTNDSIEELIDSLPFVDTHAHLHMRHFENDWDEVAKRSKRLSLIVNVSTSEEDIGPTLEVSQRLDNTYVAIGVHPHDSKDVSPSYIEKLAQLCRSNPKVVAIGEIGLDFFRNISPPDVQKKVFEDQLLLANELGLPVILHVRDAYKEVYDIIKSVGPIGRGGIVHAFSGDTHWAKLFVKEGFLIGVGGPITYPKNEMLRQVVKIIGMENVVTETDCPYLPPQHFRGKRNEPTYVVYVATKIAEIMEQSLETTVQIIHDNALKIFGLRESNR
ncbi:TatD family hydrolase [Fervidobacterium thailandense]|uniref:Hydrolase TatD n=1 Tax=Fervidobacterium thailandense TaxID=1008305 RepID=A0A1E3G1Z0_9BACT|nr:TatD family hydrolase [Fervidobacterium thailandense]ODN30277.1 hydrolase TatD [Fervidobacterium thailandense]